MLEQYFVIYGEVKDVMDVKDVCNLVVLVRQSSSNLQLVSLLIYGYGVNAPGVQVF